MPGCQAHAVVMLRGAQGRKLTHTRTVVVGSRPGRPSAGHVGIASPGNSQRVSSLKHLRSLETGERRPVLGNLALPAPASFRSRRVRARDRGVDSREVGPDHESAPAGRSPRLHPSALGSDRSHPPRFKKQGSPIGHGRPGLGSAAAGHRRRGFRLETQAPAWRRRTPLPRRTPPSQSARSYCAYCSKDISGVVRIKCAECAEVNLCVECFSAGVEPHPHKRATPTTSSTTSPSSSPSTGARTRAPPPGGGRMYGLGNWTEVASTSAPSQSSSATRTTSRHASTLPRSVPACPRFSAKYARERRAQGEEAEDGGWGEDEEEDEKRRWRPSLDRATSDTGATSRNSRGLTSSATSSIRSTTSTRTAVGGDGISRHGHGTRPQAQAPPSREIYNKRLAERQSATVHRRARVAQRETTAEPRSQAHAQGGKSTARCECSRDFWTPTCEILLEGLVEENPPAPARRAPGVRRARIHTLSEGEVYDAEKRRRIAVARLKALECPRVDRALSEQVSQQHGFAPGAGGPAPKELLKLQGGVSGVGGSIGGAGGSGNLEAGREESSAADGRTFRGGAAE